MKWDGHNGTFLIPISFNALIVRHDLLDSFQHRVLPGYYARVYLYHHWKCN